jgi:hypothetical protein
MPLPFDDLLSRLQHLLLFYSNSSAVILISTIRYVTHHLSIRAIFFSGAAESLMRRRWRR